MKTIAEIIAANRDLPSPMLSLDLPVQRLLDPENEHLMRTVDRVTGGWEVHKATQRLWENLPSSSGLYMFVWRPEFRFKMAGSAGSDSLSFVLYIGQTGRSGSRQTLKDRYRDYVRFLGGSPERLWDTEPVSTRDGRLRRFLTLQPLEYWCTVIDDPTEVDRLEDRLIKLVNPPLNGTRSPKGRPRPAEPAFRRPTD